MPWSPTSTPTSARVLKALEDKGLADNTIVVFLTDNGPAQVAVQCRPARMERVGLRRRNPRPVLYPLAGADSAPDASSTASPPISISRPRCSTPAEFLLPSGVRFDGKSLLPLLKGIQTAGWPDRHALLPVAPRRPARAWPGFRRAVRNRSSSCATNPRPAHQSPAARALRHGTRPARAAQYRQGAPRSCFRRCTPNTKRGSRTCRPPAVFEPVRIAVGSPRENPTILTRQDWRGPHAGETPNALGFWEVEVAKSGRFRHLAPLSLRASSRPRPTSHSERRKVRVALAPGRPSARSKASSCRPARGVWKPGLRMTKFGRRARYHSPAPGGPSG